MTKSGLEQTVSSKYLKDLMDEAYEIEFQYMPENNSAYWTHPPSETDRELIKMIITDMDESVQKAKRNQGFIQRFLGLFTDKSEDNVEVFDEKWDLDLREESDEFDFEKYYFIEASADYGEGKVLDTEWGRVSDTIVSRTLEERGEAIIKAKLNENPFK